MHQLVSPMLTPEALGHFEREWHVSEIVVSLLSMKKPESFPLHKCTTVAHTILQKSFERTVSCADTRYNFRHDSAFTHETTDVQVLINNWRKHRNVQWTDTQCIRMRKLSVVSRRSCKCAHTSHLQPRVEATFTSFVATNQKKCRMHVEENSFEFYVSVYACSSELVWCAMSLFVSSQ